MKRAVVLSLAVLIGGGLLRSADIAASTNAAPSQGFHFTSTPVNAHRYPWHRDINTTVFWIDDTQAAPRRMLNSTGQSVPSPAWIREYVPRRSLLNPYYIALPFNDLDYPNLARRWLPSKWKLGDAEIKGSASACQHRWIEMKNAEGKVCFAQWEDVGPICTDDAAYVSEWSGCAPAGASMSRLQWPSFLASIT